MGGGGGGGGGAVWHVATHSMVMDRKINLIKWNIINKLCLQASQRDGAHNSVETSHFWNISGPLFEFIRLTFGFTTEQWEGLGGLTYFAQVIEVVQFTN